MSLPSFLPKRFSTRTSLLTRVTVRTDDILACATMTLASMYDEAQAVFQLTLLSEDDYISCLKSCSLNGAFPTCPASYSRDIWNCFGFLVGLSSAFGQDDVAFDRAGRSPRGTPRRAVASLGPKGGHCVLSSKQRARGVAQPQTAWPTAHRADL